MKTEGSALVSKIKQLEQQVTEQIAEMAKMKIERDEAIHALEHYKAEQRDFQTKIEASRVEKRKNAFNFSVPFFKC
ncbi:hypothetical protein [Brochothrix campestris]|uniref:Uncharacterized protein n=1 Tax=Brochothrix campestris FSL F6-1037 TaxID=1265861 RepID=W7CZM5_9LIST|nr:hypothetical protein [Brochothrix campestris]EUJ42220.1 hypothetical protein BCAMP_00455 [Brochothrix campestris FSL F6-1037]